MKSKQKKELAEKKSALGISDDLLTALWIYDIDKYQIFWANKAALSLWESDSLAELKQRDFKPNTSLAVQETLLDYQQKFLQGETVSMFWRYSPKGIQKEAFCQMSGYKMDDGRIALLCEAIPSDLIDEKFNSNSIILLATYDAQMEFLSGNPPFVELISGESHQLPSVFIDKTVFLRLKRTVERDEVFEDDVLISTKQGPRWHRLIVNRTKQAHDNARLLVQQFDINERKLGELALKKDATTDLLTGLLNRRGLYKNIESILEQDSRFVIYYIDLDGFKMINDSYGHNVGDQILQTLANRLTDKHFEKGLAARFGGDEFVWVIREEDIEDSQQELANRLIKKLNQPYFDKEGHPMLVSASIGISLYPQDGDNFNDLILRADSAMYLAKKQGKRRWVNYIKGMESHLKRQSRVAQYLFRALAHKELLLHYQPIFNVRENQVHSFEALLRWNSPQLGWVPADETVAVAERVGVINEIENWVIQQAAQDLLMLRQLTGVKVSMAINISGIHFVDPHLGSYIKDTLKSIGLKAGDITVELTESALLSDIDNEVTSANRIAESGVNLSIDDFGTGYSSLAYLHKIPASIVKIDRSFTERVVADPTMITSIFNLITNLKLCALVEGVETLEQSRLLEKIGINLQQGYGLGRPKPIEYYLNSPSEIFDLKAK